MFSIFVIDEFYFSSNVERKLWKLNNLQTPESTKLAIFFLTNQMIERKKAEGRKRRRKKDIDLINDNDDAIAKMIADMRLAAREDRDLNIERYNR